MNSKSTTVEAYLNELPPDRQPVMVALRNEIVRNIPKGFIEVINYGMIGYVVPHSIYPSGYHCKPQDPLPFLNIASQKSFIAIYHMGIYADKKLLDWFVEAYAQLNLKKLDMGKSCIRFKKPDEVPINLIGELVSKWTPKEWIEVYESVLKR